MTERATGGAQSGSVNTSIQTRPDLAVMRVRHPVKIRALQVVRVESVTAHLRRITLGGADLHDFVSESFDDHVKVFFPAPGQDRPVLPELGPDGPVFAAGAARPLLRDFTPRRFDRDAGELDLEFALHEAGPATAWAAQAQVGQHLGIGGPRGSTVVPTGFDWHLLIGDDTALPAIARRLEELPATTRAIAVIEVADPRARIGFTTRASLDVVWSHRNAPGEDLLRAVAAVRLPDGEGYAWAAGESGAIRAVRRHLLNERGIDKSRVHAAGYWKRGAQGVHDKFED